MSITEKYIQQQTARREGRPENEQPQKKAEGPTLKEILANKDQSDLFGDYLGTEGAEDLGEKLRSGTLDSSDFAELAEKRKGFLEILDRSKLITESLDMGSIAKLVESSPDLRIISESVGKEGIKNSLAKHLPRIAIGERQRFVDLENSLRQMAETKKTIATKDEEIKKFCKEAGVSEDEYLQILKTGDPEKITKMIRSQYGIFKRIFTSRKKHEDKIHQQSLDDTREIERNWDSYNADMKSVGSLLHLTMMENPLIKETLIADLRKDVVEKKDPNMSFSEMKDIIDATKKVPATKEGLKADFDKYKDEHKDLSEEQALREFSQTYAREKAKKKPGFWAKIFTAFLSSEIEGLIKEK